MKTKKHKLGIVLSGGGARGIAHLGVLDALRIHGIEPDVIAGASMGAIVGCFYCAGFDPGFILEEIKKEKLLRFITLSLPGDGILDFEYLSDLMKKHIGKNDFSALKKPLFVSVTNLNSGKNEIISEGKLFEFVIASATIPVLFKTQAINKQTYIDGGLLNNLPVLAIRDICKKVIAVNVNYNGPKENIHGVKDIIERCLRLSIETNVKENVAECDFLIQPDESKDYNTFDFRKADEIYQFGFDATKQLIPEIIKAVGQGNLEADIELERKILAEKEVSSEGVIGKTVSKIKNLFENPPETQQK